MWILKYLLPSWASGVEGARRSRRWHAMASRVWWTPSETRMTWRRGSMPVEKYYLQVVCAHFNSLWKILLLVLWNYTFEGGRSALCGLHLFMFCAWMRCLPGHGWKGASEVHRRRRWWKWRRGRAHAHWSTPTSRTSKVWVRTHPPHSSAREEGTV